VIESARAVGFTRVSTDLVFGLPNQSPASVRSTIEKLLSMEPDRVFCSAFSRHPAAFQHQSAVDERQLPSLGDKVAIFSRIVEGLCDAGYEWIGLDCFARGDDEIVKAHREGDLHRNWIGYTTQPGRSLLGLGSSAASDLETLCARNAMSIEQWRDAIERGEFGVDRGTVVDAHARQRRHALSDLMCNLQRKPEAPDQPTKSEDNEDLLSTLMEDGLIEYGNEGLAVTDSGRVTLLQLWGRATTAALPLI
jgi:oxygen-independent coproporphyrinogen-3 oxidase